MPIQASAPGKLILAGEHAAVYGHPALVAAVGLRARATATRVPAFDRVPPASVSIELPELGERVETTWERIVEETTSAREHWRIAMERPGSFRPLSRDASALVRLALGEALAARPGCSPLALGIEVRSQIPLGAGCGSSAAVASVVVASTLALLDRDDARAAQAPPDLAEIERVVLEVERRQHGAPSGVDAATVLRGGVLWCQRRDGALTAEPVGAAQGLDASLLPQLGAFALLHTGTPCESTGEVVSRVRMLRDAEPSRVEPALRRIAEAARRLRGAVEQGESSETLGALRECARGLEELDVVPPTVRALCRRVEQAGGAAKVSGAGAGRGEAAGVVLVYHPSPAALATLRDTVDIGTAHWLPETSLGVAGLELAAAVPDGSHR